MDINGKKVIVIGGASGMGRASAELLAARGASELEMGIGIHTGRVIVGNIGSLRRAKYAAVGSNVNLTGRIESCTTGGQILISEDTRQQIGAALRIDRQFEVQPKGTGRSLRLHQVGGLGAPHNLFMASRVEVLHPLPQPLPVRYSVIEGKLAGGVLREAALVEASATHARLAAESLPPPLSDLRILADPGPCGNPSGELYAKVVEAAAEPGGSARIRFTSVTPELKAWLGAFAGA